MRADQVCVARDRACIEAGGDVDQAADHGRAP